MDRNYKYWHKSDWYDLQFMLKRWRLPPVCSRRYIEMISSYIWHIRSACYALRFKFACTISLHRVTGNSRCPVSWSTSYGITLQKIMKKSTMLNIFDLFLDDKIYIITAQYFYRYFHHIIYIFSLKQHLAIFLFYANFAKKNQSFLTGISKPTEM